jgi:hypothetical protein
VREERTREERIKEYAYNRFIFRAELCSPPRPGDDKDDWDWAEHLVSSEDWAKGKVK